MNKIKIALVLQLIFFFSYASPKVHQPVLGSPKEMTFDKSELAKKWLVKAIENFFKQESADMSSITTKSYNDYKTDAMNIDMDTEGSLTLEQFNKKWKKKYDVKYAGYDGFLISAQDWVKIVVSKCELISAKGNVYIFQVIIKDAQYKSTSKGTSKLSNPENHF